MKTLIERTHAKVTQLYILHALLSGAPLARSSARIVAKRHLDEAIATKAK
jgi:hypothetical protein